MSFGIPLMLAGLTGVAIPIIIHLLNRRRYEQVDWGAMRFLQISETTRRRLFLEELLLLLLRMGLIAILVMGLAAPVADSHLFGLGSSLVARDVVLLIDGSYSMGYTDGGKSPHELAKEWALDFIDNLAAGDRVSVLQAKQRVAPLVGELTGDLGRVRMTIDRLALPRGGCDWPLAVQEAFKVVSKSTTSRRDIVILSDGQRYGWADETTMMRWELLAKRRDREAEGTHIWVVNLDPQRPADPPNWTLAPLRASRAVASIGQQVTIHTALEIRGQQGYKPPHRLRLEIDGRPAGDLDPPKEMGSDKGQVPFSFRHRFATPGSHLVSVIVEPDPPMEQRPAGYLIKDQLPGDNRQDWAVDVLPALPVLLVDGNARSAAKNRGSDFLRDALAPARDPEPVVLARVVPVKELTPLVLTSDLSTEAGTSPRVLVLVNVPRLLTQQQEAVMQFLANGGGVLVTLGEQVDPRHYNDQWFANGEGWLPARLVEIAGDEAKPELAPNPLPSSFFHPAVDLFREAAAGGLGKARFPRWWKVTVPTRPQSSSAGSPASAIVALLTNQDPFLVEKSYRGGRVMLCAVPLDNSWHTNLPELPAFAPLAHELIYFLAGARSAQNNLQPGQPLRYRPEKDEPLNSLVLQPPGGEAKRLVYETGDAAKGYLASLVAAPQGSLVVYEQTLETGAYRLTRQTGPDRFFVVQPDPRESDLTPCTEMDREKVSKLLPMTYENDRGRMAVGLADAFSKQELWWWFLLAVIALLCGEIWMTRRIVKGR